MGLDSRIRTMPLKSDTAFAAQDRSTVEAHIGAHLPDSLIALLGTSAQAITFEDGVEIKPLQPNSLAGQDGRQSVLVVLGLSSGRDGISETYDQYKTRLGDQYIPVASDGLGNLFVLHATSQEVLFWYHECPQGEASPEAFTLVANDFDQFLSELQPEEETKEKASNISGVKKYSFDF
ncbi:SMI1/KNR4 family protein [Paracoccus alkanivorans]|uniref:Knr4/Smi1-like domain-containing protein n=1 Tax=Paracoccus alkanivorans TaxID=2116655 RepID=A0A3M0LXA9_9RHOB|nr:SMI1/KNR4 family protein [Paracoccus alkanivorans]RMC30118.1 hypothetical protein C9E81_22030 [Paracoccus alkanivorans]